jgi:triosephosphate isomerase
VGNWKLNSPDPAGFEGIGRPDVDVVICPPVSEIDRVRAAVGADILIGAQDCFWIGGGAFTGQVSATLLKSHGCAYCIVGHSERRGRFGASQFDENLLPFFSDTDEVVSLKLSAALSEGLKPILCVGETESERSTRRTDDVIASQLGAALKRANAGDHFCVAYEPVWAIGTGNVCDEQEAAAVCARIRDWISSHVADAAAESARVLYGGSVTPDNAPRILAQRDIDGVLVGGASLSPQSFRRIIEQA